MNFNVLQDVDSYKTSHWKLYDPEVTHLTSYLVARKLPAWAKGVVVFGVARYVNEVLSQRITTTDIDSMQSLMNGHIGPGVFNYDGWRELVRAHPWGLPLEVWSMPEGSVVAEGDPILYVRNTDPRFPWLTTWIETSIEQLWYPMTVATFAHEAKRRLRNTALIDGTPLADVDFKLHDFGARGAASEQAAGIGGAAHLTSFKGSDNVPALFTLARNYDCGEGPVAFNIPAAEHSTVTSWGRDREDVGYEHALDAFGDAPLLSIVSDSYDYERVVKDVWGGSLKDKVLMRNGTLVVRPDSGDVVDTVLWTLNMLGRAYGTTRNARGYHVLNPHVRVIQGDGMNLTTLQDTLHAMTLSGWSLENVTFGMGGALLQKHDRDTLGFGYKLCGIEREDGETEDIVKSPTASSMKRSRGYAEMWRKGLFDAMEPVFEGRATNLPWPKFDDIRRRVEADF